MSRWWRAVAVLLLVGVSAATIGYIAKEVGMFGGPSPASPALYANPVMKPGGSRAAPSDTPVELVRPDRLDVSLDEWGLVEASQDRAVSNPVSGQVAIAAIVPEGTPVKAGEIVCELDSASLQNSLLSQRIVTQAAQTAYSNAKLAREIAEVAVVEYTEGTYRQLSQSAKAQVTAAESSVKQGEERRDRILKARKRLDDLLAAKGAERTATEIVADVDLDDRVEAVSQSIARAKYSIELANAREAVLEKYEKIKRTQELRRDVEKALSEELSKKLIWELEKTKEAVLERQIKSCILTAPSDGVVVYANSPNRFGGVSSPPIEEGAPVRPGQSIFSIPNPEGPMHVNIKVPEAKVGWLAPGLRARITVEDFANQPIPGRVEQIARFPDPRTNTGPNARVYNTRIAIESRPFALAPGMAARVEILAAPLGGVLSVPVSSVVYYDGKDRAAVMKPDGTFEWRDVLLGLSNGQRFEVKKGIKGGDSVAIDPAPLLSGGQKLKISLAPPRPSPAPRRAPDIVPERAGGKSPRERPSR